MPGKRATSQGANANARTYYVSGTILVLLIVAVVFRFVLHSPTLVKATSHQPEAYTELYFTNATILPSYITRGAVLPVSFTVHNVEARSMDYTYQVEITAPNNTTHLLAQQSFSLNNNATKNVNLYSVMPNETGRYEVSVTLLHLPEAIHFWVEDRS